MIRNTLEEYPLWKEKFVEDVNKQLAYSHLKFHNDEIFEIIDQQKAFK
jgi:hypothetical protein